jgi:hypothetical protein
MKPSAKSAAARPGPPDDYPSEEEPRKDTSAPVRPGLLTGWMREHELAAELGRNVRTLQRWRDLRIGPPVTMIGDTPIYSIDEAKRWLQAGGTAGVAKARRRGRS